MKFYINEIEGMGDWNHQYIGLFTNNDRTAEGSFAGWYGAEYYHNTTILAYGIQLKEGGKCYDPKDPFDGGFCADYNKHCDKVTIGSGYWEKTIEADSIEEAIEIFKNQSWED